MKFIKKLLILLLVALVIIITVITLNGYKLYQLSIEKISLNDMVYSKQSDDNFVKIDTLPTYYKNAVIAVEDHRFEKHGAIDFIAIGRAIVRNISNFKLLEGGSTITQQVANNLYFIEEDVNPILRKVAEIFVAFDLEKQYSKNEILELYINTSYFGDGYYGVKEACNGYLNKDPKDMTLYDATMLAGIPNAPSVYAPTVNPDLTQSRQEKVIQSMVKYGYLSQEEADKLILNDN